MKSRPRNDLDKPRYQSSLIRVFVVHTVDMYGLLLGLFMLTGKD